MMSLNLKTVGCVLTYLICLAAATTFKVSPSKTVPNGASIQIDNRYQSYSIEFCYMVDFAGNKTHPNTLSNTLLQNLISITGASPIIRAGGSSANHVTYFYNQTVAIINNFSSPTADQPGSLTIGPGFWNSFTTFPGETQYIVGLNLEATGSDAFPDIIREFNTSLSVLGKNIYAYELGNEVSGFAGTHRPATWGPVQYVQEFLNDTAALASTFPSSRSLGPLWQGGVLAGARSANWSAEILLQDGIDSTGMVKTMSQHEYMGANCDTTSIPTIANSILTHNHTVDRLGPHVTLAAYCQSKGVPYVLGETNSISCQGTDGISNVYASALWSVDYQLYAASKNISRVYFHQGTPYRYSAWQPIDVSFIGPAEVRPLYYGNIFFSHLIAGSQSKQVSILFESDQFTSYAIYEAKKLFAVVGINYQTYNSTMTSIARPEATLSGVTGGKSVRRLSGFANVATNITVGGITFNPSTGQQVGKEKLETVRSDGSVLVGASEAVAVFF